MTDIPKRLQNSLNRIRRCGGVVLIHHTSMGSVDYQLPNGGGAIPQHNLQTPQRRTPSLRQGRPFRWRRTNSPCGRTMSKFEDDLRARISIINRMISGAKTAERRALQKERADLEDKLRRTSA